VSENFIVGEIVESNYLRVNWCRAHVRKVLRNHCYDVKFDTGDEVRFVPEKSIRCLPEKKPYSYRVELGILMMVIMFPICLAFSLLYFPGLLLLGQFLFSISLISIRVVLFIQYFYNLYSAGFCVALQSFLFFSLPLLFLLIVSILCLTSAGSSTSVWMSISVLFIISLFSSLPILYCTKPTYALIGFVLSLLFSISAIMLSLLVDNQLNYTYNAAIAFSPLIVTIFCIKYVRTHLLNIWDVSLVIRKERDMSQSNPSIFKTLRDYYNKKEID
jgi:hypothetical protein